MQVALSWERNPEFYLINEELSLTFPLLLFPKLPLLILFYFAYFIKTLQHDTYPIFTKTGHIFQSLPKRPHIFGIIVITEYPIFL